MKFFIVFALFAGALAAPNNYGHFEQPALVRSAASYDQAPAFRSSGYESAPALKVSEPAYGGYGGAAAVRSFEHIPIVKQLLDDDNYGSYNLQVETGNGIRSSEIGSLVDVGGPDSEGPVNVKKGSYSYTSPEGIPITTTWVADQNGFRASGAHLPVPPPIPAEILKSLQSTSSYGYDAPALRVDSGAYHHEPALRVESGYHQEPARALRVDSGAYHHEPALRVDSGAYHHEPALRVDSGAYHHEPALRVSSGAYHHEPALLKSSPY